MKKWIGIILCICMLAGCSLQPAQTTTPPAVQTVPAETVPPETMPQKDILDYSSPLFGNPVLRRVDCEYAEELPYLNYIETMEDRLILGYYTEELGPRGSAEDRSEYGLMVLDIHTGEKLAQALVPYQDSRSVQILDNQILFSDWGGGKIMLLDPELHVLKEKQISDKWSMCYGDMSGKFVYPISNDGKIRQINLETEEEKNILADTYDLYSSACYGNSLSLNFIDEKTLLNMAGVLNLATGSFEPAPFQGAFYSAERIGEFWLGTYESQIDTYMLGKGGQASRAYIPGGYLGMVSGPAPVSISRYLEDDSQTLSLYRENGSYYGGFSVNPGWYTGAPLAWSSQKKGYFMLLHSPEGEPIIAFYSGRGTGEAISMEKPEEAGQPEGELPQELYEQARSISQKYGVNVFIGDRASLEFDDFTARPVLDAATISSTLDILTNVLDTYPEGFFRQLPFGYYQSVDIHLVGRLKRLSVPDNCTGYTSFAGFVSHGDSRHYMVLDICQPDLDQTMYHEFSHIIDSRLEFRARHTAALYSEDQWKKLNPPTFAYSQSVYELNDDTHNREYDSYFIDDYARTYPTEDRARIMEYAMTGHLWYFEENAPLREKLAYYSAAIRDGFDTKGWPETTPWEDCLEGYRYGQAEKAA